MAAGRSQYALRIALFYAGYFTVQGVQLPFLPVWLESRGLTDDEIAVALALPLFLRVVLTPLASWAADRAPNRRFAIRVYSFAAVAVFAFADSVEGFWPIALVAGTALLMWNVALPAAEALALTGVRRFGLDFGRMRLFGSISFIVANLASGALIGVFSPAALFWLLLGVLVVSALTSLTLPVTPPELRALDDAERAAPRPPGRVLLHPAFLGLMTAGGLVLAGHAMLYGFGSLYWQSLGYSPVAIGALWATGVIAEIALFSMSGRVARRFGAWNLMAAGGAAALLRWTLFPLDIGLPGYFLLQVLHGLTFGATFLGIQQAILTRIPDRSGGTAQGINAMIGGLMMAVATVLSGPLYRALGGWAFTTMVVPAAAGLAILLVLRIAGRRGRETPA